MRDEFLRTLMTSMHGDPALLMQSGTTVAGTDHRAENHVTAGYLLGEHFVVTCDPAVEQMLVHATSGMKPTLEAWSQVAIDAGGEFLGSGRMQLLGRDPAVVQLPEGFAMRTLDREVADDLTLIQRFVDASDEDDLDEAEIGIDKLDAIIDVVIDAHGDIASFASGGPFDLAPAYGDIGIMTRPDCRGKDLGSAAVAALCPRLRASGLEPLYRCDEDNAGSVALSRSIGFEIATQLTAFRFPVES